MKVLLNIAMLLMGPLVFAAQPPSLEEYRAHLCAKVLLDANLHDYNYQANAAKAKFVETDEDDAQSALMKAVRSAQISEIHVGEIPDSDFVRFTFSVLGNKGESYLLIKKREMTYRDANIIKQNWTLGSGLLDKGRFGGVVADRHKDMVVEVTFDTSKRELLEMRGNFSNILFASGKFEKLVLDEVVRDFSYHRNFPPLYGGEEYIRSTSGLSHRLYQRALQVAYEKLRNEMVEDAHWHFELDRTLAGMTWESNRDEDGGELTVSYYVRKIYGLRGNGETASSITRWAVRVKVKGSEVEASKQLEDWQEPIQPEVEW